MGVEEVRQCDPRTRPGSPGLTVAMQWTWPSVRCLSTEGNSCPLSSALSGLSMCHVSWPDGGQNSKNCSKS